MKNIIKIMSIILFVGFSPAHSDVPNNDLFIKLEKLSPSVKDWWKLPNKKNGLNAPMRRWWHFPSKSVTSYNIRRPYRPGKLREKISF
jgi:hypothetical protein